MKNTNEEVQLKYNLRQGKIGSGKEELPEEIQAILNHKTKDTYEKAYALYRKQILSAGLVTG